jgi:CheY-like chemotaxis protein/anti-sigma regulatory factor (Ser/Thr protein kinase)
MSDKILIVDDDEFFRSLTREVLEQCGYAIETAADGIEALDKINSDPSRFDLVLLDKQMPRLDGIGVLKRLKSDPRLVNLPVVMLTGDSRQEDITEGLAEGAFYYLIKPSAENVLKLVIKNSLEDFRQKRELRDLVGRQENNLQLLRRGEFTYSTLEEARDLALLLADLSLDPGRTVSGYSELLINAVEHGNLGISYAEKSMLLREDRWSEEVELRLKHPQFSKRFVSVTLTRTDTSSTVTITDQGKGFNWRDYVEFAPERAFDIHGRGIAMSKAISFDSLEYVGSGNTVVTMVRFPTV